MSEEKIAIVTGSSSGIGLLTTVVLARNGYRVAATMRDLGRSSRLEEAAQKAGVRDRLDLRRGTERLTPFGLATPRHSTVCVHHGGP